MQSSAEVFDPLSGAWTSLPPMASRRMQPTACGVGKRIYVCGGYGGELTHDEPLETVERYDPALNQWEIAPKMAAKRYNATSASVGPLLFVFGGATDKTEPLKTVERFDARENTQKWEGMPVMKEKREGAGSAISREGHPIVCGGHNGVKCLSSVERLLPGGNKTWLEGGREGTWQALPDMLSPRFGLACCVALHNDRKGKVFVFGGHSGLERLASGECLCNKETTGEYWESVPKQKNKEIDGKEMDARAGAAVAILKDDPYHMNKKFGKNEGDGDDSP